jgi:thiol-disulfide isomerase/thioredoxin
VSNISLNNPNGRKISLDDIDSKRTLIVFYSSECPHCRELMPKLDELYEKQADKEIEILAVSLDEKKADWIDYIEENELSYINVSAAEGWDSQTAQDYSIYATPMMFLVDEAKEIIVKPTTFQGVKKYIN